MSYSSIHKSCGPAVFDMANIIHRTPHSLQLSVWDLHVYHMGLFGGRIIEFEGQLCILCSQRSTYFSLEPRRALMTTRDISPWEALTCKGSLTIRPFSSSRLKNILVNCSTFAFYLTFHSLSKENIKVLGFGAIFVKQISTIEIFMFIRAFCCTNI